jgi:hypothetical protein
MSETPEPTPEPDPTPDPEPDEGDEEEEAEQTPAEAAAKDGSSALRPELERANELYIKRVQKIVGKTVALNGCEKCQGMGYLLGDEVPIPELVRPDNLVVCVGCNGYGLVDTPSLNPDHSRIVCTKCSGIGYITIAPQSNVTPITATQPVQVNQQIMGTMMPDGTFVPFYDPNQAANPIGS